MTTALISWSKLIRWENLAIVAVTLLVLRWVFPVAPNLSTGAFVAMLVGTMAIAAAGNIINDIFDYEIDVINKPTAVIINNQISILAAWWGYVGFNLLGIGLAIVFLPTVLLLFFLGAIGLLFLYSYRFKKWPLIGNLTVALLCAWVVVEFWWVAAAGLESETNTLLLGYTFFAFQSTLIRELTKDLEDQEGDQQQDCLTFPLWVGTFWTHLLITFLVVVLGVALGGLTFFFFQKNDTILAIYTLITLIGTLPFFLGILFRLPHHNQKYHTLSQYAKMYMLLGLILLILIHFLF